MQELRLYWEGTEASVRASVARAHAAGQLVEVRAVGATEPGLVAAAVVLRTPTAPRQHPDTPRQRSPRRTVWLAGGGCAAGLAVGVPSGWAARWLLEWVAAHAAGILGGLAVLIVLTSWWLAGQAGACPGLHCPGCRCG